MQLYSEPTRKIILWHKKAEFFPDRDYRTLCLRTCFFLTPSLCRKAQQLLHTPFRTSIKYNYSRVLGGSISSLRKNRRCSFVSSSRCAIKPKQIFLWPVMFLEPVQSLAPSHEILMEIPSTVLSSCINLPGIYDYIIVVENPPYYPISPPLGL